MKQAMAVLDRLPWIAVLLLFVMQVWLAADMKDAEEAAQAQRDEIMGALRVRPYEVMERLNVIAGELERRNKYVDQLKAQGLISD